MDRERYNLFLFAVIALTLGLADGLPGGVGDRVYWFGIIGVVGA